MDSTDRARRAIQQLGLRPLGEPALPDRVWGNQVASAGQSVDVMRYPVLPTNERLQTPAGRPVFVWGYSALYLPADDPGDTLMDPLG